MAMNELKNIIMLYKTPIHVLVCKVGHKTHVFFFISVCAVSLKLMVQITSIFGSYRFLSEIA